MDPGTYQVMALPTSINWKCSIVETFANHPALEKGKLPSQVDLQAGLLVSLHLIKANLAI
jgi:hypothetical protein